MHSSTRLTVALAAAAVGFASTPSAELTAQTFPLTVDSIMRGPKLVGYPPSGLRWSGDSSRLYFEWRHPGEDEAATWVVDREGGTPRRLTDAERKSAPPPIGLWDGAHRRIAFVDQSEDHYGE